MNTYVIPDEDAVKIKFFVSDACKKTPRLLDFAEKASVLSRNSIFSEISQFVAEQISVKKSPYFLIRNIPIDDTEPTPQVIAPQNAKTPRFNDGIAMLFSAMGGQIFSFPEAQHGNMTCDISPIKQSEEIAIGSGSKIKFEWHTDNAYLRHPGDFFTLMCVRNPDLVPTIIASPDLTDLPIDASKLLHESVFTIRPNRIGKAGQEDVAKQSILFGHPDSPYLRLNMNYNMCAGLDKKYTEALNILRDFIAAAAEPITLQSGDLVFVDNYKTAHERPSFTAGFTERDRLLKRTYVETSWRGMAFLRQDPDSLIVSAARPG